MTQLRHSQPGRGALRASLPAEPMQAYPAPDLCCEVLSEVRRFSGNQQFDDDLCLFEVSRGYNQ